MPEPLISKPCHKADPFPLYQQLRAKGPVAKIKLGRRKDAWLITSYAAAKTAFQNKSLVKNRNSIPGGGSGPIWLPRLVRPLLQNMLDVDEPDHRRLKNLVKQAFKPKRVAETENRIASLCEANLERLKRQPEIELVADYALPLPTRIIADMLGIPEVDIPRFVRWTNAIVGTDASNLRMLNALPKIISFLRYIRRLIRIRRNEQRDDLLSDLIAAEESGDRLSEDELVAMVFLLLVAGFETTVNLISNSILCLTQHPEQLEQLRNNSSLDASAVEEFLRYCGPLDVATERFAAEEIEIGDAKIPQGGLVYIGISSANRDETQFDEADKLILERDPNSHLSFGFGSHYCLGASLARLETTIAIRKLLDRTSDFQLRLRPEKLRWKSGIVLRGTQQLPLKMVWK